MTEPTTPPTTVVLVRNADEASPAAKQFLVWAVFIVGAIALFVFVPGVHDFFFGAGNK